MSADLYSDLTNGLGMKNYPKMTPHMLQSAQWFQSYKDFFIMSADLYTDLTIVFASKNYPKRTPQMSKSLHWIKSYVGFNFSGGGHFANNYRIVRGGAVLPTITA